VIFGGSGAAEIELEPVTLEVGVPLVPVEVCWIEDEAFWPGGSEDRRPEARLTNEVMAGAAPWGALVATTRIPGARRPLLPQPGEPDGSLNRQEPEQRTPKRESPLDVRARSADNPSPLWYAGRAARWRTKLSTAIAEFVRHTELEKSRATAAAYGSDLSLMARMSGRDTVLAFMPELVQRYLTDLSEQGRKMSTLHRKTAALREFARWGVRRGLWTEDPTREMPRIRRPQTLPRPFDVFEISKLMSLELPSRERVVRALLYYTGIRVSPLCSIRVWDVTYATTTVAGAEFPGTIRSEGKGAKPLITPMHPDLREVLLDFTLSTHGDLRGTSYLVTQANGRPLRRRLVEKMTARWGERAGVADCVPHRFRHTFATELLRRGVDIRVIQALLGHADLRSTTIYTQVHDTQTIDAVLRLPSHRQEPAP